MKFLVIRRTSDPADSWKIFAFDSREEAKAFLAWYAQNDFENNEQAAQYEGNFVISKSRSYAVYDENTKQIEFMLENTSEIPSGFGNNVYTKY